MKNFTFLFSLVLVFLSVYNLSAQVEPLVYCPFDNGSLSDESGNGIDFTSVGGVFPIPDIDGNDDQAIRIYPQDVLIQLGSINNLFNSTKKSFSISFGRKKIMVENHML